MLLFVCVCIIRKYSIEINCDLLLLRYYNIFMKFLSIYFTTLITFLLVAAFHFDFKFLSEVRTGAKAFCDLSEVLFIIKNLLLGELAHTLK